MSGTFPISRFLASLVVVSITYLLVGQTAAAGSTISAGFISYVDTSCNAAAIQNLALYINNSCYFSTKYVCNETSFTVYRCAGSADCSTNCVEESCSYKTSDSFFLINMKHGFSNLLIFSSQPLLLVCAIPLRARFTFVPLRRRRSSWIQLDCL